MTFTIWNFFRLLAYRDFDDGLGLTNAVAGMLADSRAGKNVWRRPVGLLF